MAIANTLRVRARRTMPAAEPNVIPFIDVLLVLLIIFMVTAPKPTTDLRLDLPSGGTPVQVDIAPTIVDVLPNADGGARFLINGDEVALIDLTNALLQRIAAQNGGLDSAVIMAEARVFVRADLDLAYTHVVSVIDQMQHEGFEKVGVFSQSAD